LGLEGRDISERHGTSEVTVKIHIRESYQKHKTRGTEKNQSQYCGALKQCEMLFQSPNNTLAGRKEELHISKVQFIFPK
jgi:hypothetical protein